MRARVYCPATNGPLRTEPLRLAVLVLVDGMESALNMLHARAVAR